MSLTTDIKQAVRDSLIDLADDIDDRDARELIIDTERSLSSDALSGAVEPIVALNQRKAAKLDEEGYDELVEDLAQIVADSIAYDNLKDRRLTRNITADMERDLKISYKRFIDFCNDYEEAREEEGTSRRRGRSRNKDDDRGGSRRGGRNKSRGRNRDTQGRRGNRHMNEYERDDLPEREKKVVEAEEVEIKTETSKPKVFDGDVITEKNYSQLPEGCRDVPFYYAGLENLIYREETGNVVVNLLEGDSDVNYQQHRTDTYLKANREPEKAAVSNDKLEKQLKAAAQEKVNAYVTTTSSDSAGEVSEPVINNLKIEKSCIISGVYQFDFGITGNEARLRRELTTMLGDKFNQQVTGITVSHQLIEVDETSAATKDWDELIAVCQSLAVNTKFNDVKTLLDLAQKFFDPQSYHDLHTVINTAVCNALSCSLKLGLKTTSIVTDWADLVNLIEKQQAVKPYIVGVLNTNLAAALPTLFIEGGKVKMLRNYIFLPISKNEFTVASPIRYATLNQSVRPALYGVIDKLMITNVPPETSKALTTLVTLENESLTVFTNRDLIKDSGFYIFSPL